MYDICSADFAFAQICECCSFDGSTIVYFEGNMQSRDRSEFVGVCRFTNQLEEETGTSGASYKKQKCEVAVATTSLISRKQ